MTSSHEMKPYSRTKRLYYWCADRVMGLIGIAMIVALIVFTLPPDLLLVLVVVVALVAYVVIAVALIMTEWM